MANTSNGSGWDPNAPADGDPLASGAQEIRDLRKGLALRLSKEHIAPSVNSVGGEHIEGSGMVYVNATAPSYTPGTNTIALGASDTGRLWVNEDNGVTQWWDGSAWQPVGPAYAVIVDMEPGGTHGDGGTAFNDNAWRIRVLNYVLYDEAEIIVNGTGTGSIPSPANKFTLGPGTYRIKVSAPAYRVDNHQCRIYNISGTAVLVEGTAEYASFTYYGGNRSIAITEVTVAAALPTGTSFRIEHRCQTSNTTNGFGETNSFATNHYYTIVEIWKIA